MKKETKKLIKEKLVKPLLSICAGLSIGEVSNVPIHELGHWTMFKIRNYFLGLDREPSIEIKSLTSGVAGPNECIGKDEKEILAWEPPIAAGGVIFNYLAGFGFATAANKLDKYTHKNLKIALNTASLIHSFEPLAYSIRDYFDKPPNDFGQLNNYGIPFEVTIPLTFAITSGLVYYNIKGYKDTVGKKVKRIEYNGMNWREKRKKWKEDKRELIDDFEEYFDGTKNSKRKAKKAWKRLNNIEVIGNDYKDKDVEKFAKDMGMSYGEAMTIVDEYVWDYDNFKLNAYQSKE